MNWIFQYLKSMGPNFGMVTNRLYRGALPKDYEKLREKGITFVINLIDGDQSEERRKAEEADLGWIHIPMSDKAMPQDEDAEACLAVMSDYSKTVFIHCKGGRHRTGVMVALYRIRKNNWTYKDAYSEMKKFGWYSALGHGVLKQWLLSYTGGNLKYGVDAE